MNAGFNSGHGSRWFAGFLVIAVGCGGASGPPHPAAAPRPSILLVTLDTTRADAIGPDAKGVETPAYNRLAARGRVFAQAYATVPETLPAHSSMMTGLYPGGHGVHENARFLAARHPVVAEALKEAGYRTAAFVSAFVLARRFGIARGFDLYDDELAAGTAERSSSETTARALAHLAQASGPGPIFLWVHYFDPHAPYEPPEPFRSRYPKDPYRAEVAAMDEQLGRLVDGFESRVAANGGTAAVVVASDHGEGLGDHGEAGHGHLLYQPTMHVPMVVVGPNVPAGSVATPVSTRRVFHTLMDWAGQASPESLAAPAPAAEVVIGEAMKPFLQYGWQPQIMTVSGPLKAILSGRTEVYDVASDPAEARELGTAASLPAPMRAALDEYPVPSLEAAASASAPIDEDARQKLASLGYVSGTAAPAVRRDAPRAADMVRLFGVIDAASTLFVRGDYARVVPLLLQILAADPQHLDATMRLATAYSALGRDGLAIATFRRAAAIAPKSQDVRLYLALHYAKGREWPRAVPLLEQVVAESPERVPALEALALARAREGRLADSVALRQRLFALRPASPAELVQLGRAAMGAQQTDAAIGAFERAKAAQGAAFAHHLELGVLYLAARRLDDARRALDAVPASHPERAMVLFKRAQVSVLLNEPDRAARIAAARRGADATTRALNANERLFR
ncbi:MAG: sulfatase-like hydrolase/transferase [Acidobacteria bacterium]|nr:sulfatase-like hydrolase/transferase [Acidobacteriota bacterium]